MWAGIKCLGGSFQRDGSKMLAVGAGWVQSGVSEAARNPRAPRKWRLDERPMEGGAGAKKLRGDWGLKETGQAERCKERGTSV